MRYIEALRNPAYKQLRGGVVSGGGDVCALSLARRVLRSEWQELFLIVDAGTLFYLNEDARLTFPQIADWLETEYLNTDTGPAVSR